MPVLPRIVYSPHYNIGLLGLERLHPFDSRKYARAWRALRQRFGRQLSHYHVRPPGPIRRADLLAVHSPAYLKRLHGRKFLAGLLEIPPLRHLPGWIIDWAVLRPMRWATMGTITAAREAMQHGLAINLAAGYHHARPDHGHGFCAYADVALAIHALRGSGKLTDADRVLYIDLDAHQGDGVCHTFFDDRRVFIYDQYNQFIFPKDLKARRRIDCDVPVEQGCHEADYLAALRSRLPPFIDSLTRSGGVRLAIYNAGTDIFIDDQLGGLNVTAMGVLERDRFVLTELMNRQIPTAVVLSGGYSRQSYRMVAEMVGFVLETWGK